MNIESGMFRNIENTEEEGTGIDAEFNELESGDYSPEERLEMTRELVDEVFEQQKDVSYEKAKKGGDLRHYVLPGIHGDDHRIHDTIRESYGDYRDPRTEYLRTKDRMFLKVGQGEMWVIPKSERVYFKVSMSECSTLIGQTDENIVVAHISYSESDVTEATLEFMQNNGVDFNDIQVIASVGEYQESQSQGQFAKARADKFTYMDLGIPESNIIPFEYFFDDDTKVSHNLTQIIGTNDAIFKYSLDVRGVRDEQVGEYKNEEVIEIE